LSLTIEQRKKHEQHELDFAPSAEAKKAKGKTTSSADIGSGVVVVREVKATIWQLEEIVNDARARRLQVQVAAMK